MCVLCVLMLLAGSCLSSVQRHSYTGNALTCLRHSPTVPTIGIFMLLICTQALAWNFFAETLSILLVQLAMAFMAFKKTHTMFDAYLILSLYPISLMLVASLEAIGWD